MPSPPTRDPARGWLSWAALAAATALVALIATRTILAKTGGEPAVPLDDSYIHFQFARSFAELAPFAYSPGAEPTPGATSLLWPLALSPFVALGVDGTRLIWVAWAFGWLSLGLLARETALLAARLTSQESAVAAGAMVLAFGGLVWSAGSGMEIVPFSFLLLRSARLAADWYEGSAEQAWRPRAALVVTAALVCAARPEGVLGAAAIFVALVAKPRGRTRAWALGALAAPLLPLAANWLFTGQLSSTTAIAKWLPTNPYYRGTQLFGAIGANVRLVFDTLLDGRVWSAIFIPAGARFFAWAALPALGLVTWRRKAFFRGFVVLLVAAGMLLPASYDCMLCNRLRYLWPFAPAWFVALGALADLAGLLAARVRDELLWVRVLVAGGFVGALASQLSPSMDDLAASADAIRLQQTALGRWAEQNLPGDARIGVNDTGAIAYYSRRRVFDVVGLTTKSEPRYWVAGAGSRFEHYERLPASELPTHFIVYPEWMAIPELLGQELTERTVHASILGGTRMIATVADYSLLRSAEDPADPPRGSLLDRFDVADLESEAEHGYELLAAAQAENRVFDSALAQPPRADGGRKNRSLERFTLETAVEGQLVARLVIDEPLSIRVRVDGHDVGTLEGRPADGWQELSLELPPDLGAGRRRVELVAPPRKSFAALHYWSYTAKQRP